MVLGWETQPIVLLLVGLRSPRGSWPTYHQMRNDTENKNIYGIGVMIPTFFVIYGHFQPLGVMTPGAISNVPLNLFVTVKI